MSQPRKNRVPLAALLLVAALLEGLFLLLLYSRPLDDRLPVTVAILLGAGVLYLTAVHIVFRFDFRGRGALLVILLAALAFRATLLPLGPSLSHDLYRYQWEGRVQIEGFNPYLHAPSDASVEHLRSAEYDQIPGRDVPAAYGPATELVAYAAASAGGIRAFKFASVLFDLAALACLMLLLNARGHPPARALVYAWCPLVVLEFAGQGHNDSLMVALLLLGLWLLNRQSRLTAAAVLSAATLAKWTAGLLLPLLFRRAGWRSAPIAFAAGLLISLPYLGGGAEWFAGLGAYAEKWRNNASLFDLLAWLASGETVALGAAAGIPAGLALYLAWKRADPVRAAYLLLASVLLLAPSVFPWYLTWLIPFLAFFPHPAWLLWSSTVLLSYHVVIGYSVLGVWQYDPQLVWLEYAPVYALLLWTAVRERFSPVEGADRARR